MKNYELFWRVRRLRLLVFDETASLKSFTPSAKSVCLKGDSLFRWRGDGKKRKLKQMIECGRHPRIARLIDADLLRQRRVHDAATRKL